MADKVKMELEDGGEIIVDEGLGKILMAAQGKVEIAGREIKIKKDKKPKKVK